MSLQNIGNAALNLSGLTLPAANFPVDSGATTCSAPSILAAGSSCTVGVKFSPASTGTLTSAIVFTDNALNVAGATQQVTLSGVAETAAPPPPPVISSEPANPTSATTATFAFSDAQSGVTFVCSLDSAAYAACSSGINYTSLATGTHTFAVKAADSLNNLSIATSYSWVVAPVLPPSIDAAPANPTTATSATFNFSDTQSGVTFVCSLDSAGYVACTSGVTYSSLSSGSHTFAVEAKSSVGLVSTPATWTWTIATGVQLLPGAVFRGALIAATR